MTPPYHVMSDPCATSTPKVTSSLMLPSPSPDETCNTTAPVFSSGSDPTLNVVDPKVIKPSVAVPQLDLDRRSARLLPEVHDRVPNGFICIVYVPRPLGYTVDRHRYVGIRLPAVVIARPLHIVASARDAPARHYRDLQERIVHGTDGHSPWFPQCLNVWSLVPAVPQPVDLEVVPATVVALVGVEKRDPQRESARHVANGATPDGVVPGVVRLIHRYSSGDSELRVLALVPAGQS